MSFITNNIEIFILSIIVLLVLFMITFIIMTRRYSVLRKKYLNMLNGTNAPDLELVLSNVHENIAQLQTQLAHEKKRTDGILINMKALKANVGVHRYNAYDQQGSELSFSIAFVDDLSSGVVLTGLHSREQTYLYAKALEEGSSTFALSPEEKVAISLAANKGKA